MSDKMQMKKKKMNKYWKNAKEKWRSEQGNWRLVVGWETPPPNTWRISSSLLAPSSRLSLCLCLSVRAPHVCVRVCSLCTRCCLHRSFCTILMDLVLLASRTAKVAPSLSRSSWLRNSSPHLCRGAAMRFACTGEN